MATSVQKELVSANDQYAASFADGSLPIPPAKKYLVVTCMDARIDPAKQFGVGLGDAHVIRNAGGSAQDALRSIIISEQLLGTTEILIVKHTGCGMVTFTNSDAYNIVEKQISPEARAELEKSKLDFLPFPDLDDAVKNDLKFLQSAKLIPDHITISGWVYEVETGKLRQVA